MQIDGISPHLAARYQLGRQFLTASADSGDSELARVDKLPKHSSLRLPEGRQTYKKWIPDWQYGSKAR